MVQTRFATVDVDGFPMFYREAGDRSRPAILLLHGFPTSSHMFRNLIPLLADRYHLVAPDLPGFGRSAIGSGDAVAHTFDRLAELTDRFTEVLGLDCYAPYVFDAAPRPSRGGGSGAWKRSARAGPSRRCCAPRPPPRP